MPPVNNQLGFQNFLSGKLTADVTAIATDIFIDTVPSISEGFLVIDPLTPASREVIFFTSKTSTKVSVPATGGRGVDGTSALPHFNGTTYIMAPVAAWFNYLQNGQASTDPIRIAAFNDFVYSGGVIAQSAGLVGTFANIIFWQGGVQYTATSIANKTYTASKDTYVDVLGNSDGTITIAYNEVANNAASPALTSGYTRMGIVITSGAAITGVNQGAWNAAAPTVSSTSLELTDTLGNLIFPTDPYRRTLGGSSLGSVSGVTGASATVITGANARVLVPAGGCNVTIFADFDCNASAANLGEYSIRIDGSQVKAQRLPMNGTGGWSQGITVIYNVFLAAGLHTIATGVAVATGSGSISVGNVTMVVNKR